VNVFADTQSGFIVSYCLD